MVNRKDVLLRAAAAALAIVAVAGVAAADFATGYETAVSLLYLVPLYAAAWFSWAPAAVLIAVASGLSDSLLTSLIAQNCPTVTVVNSAIQSIFFVVFVYVLLALKRAHRRLERYSRTDPLTDLANGRYFFEAGRAETERVIRYKRPFSLVYMDMDNFKAVNDTLGHGIGDTFLREIAEKVKSSIRKTDMMARLGGDEFGILMPETDDGAVRQAVGRIQASLRDMRMPGGGPATFSIGVITNKGAPCTFDEMIRGADALMYEAKHAGKNTFRAGVVDGAPAGERS